LRSTRGTRAIVAQHAETIAAAYPARAEDAYAALIGHAPWAGPALLWCELQDRREGDQQGRRARVRALPPRHITVGR
jgi:hypothetical protein